MIFNFIDDLERFEEMELELEEDQSTKRKVLKDHSKQNSGPYLMLEIEILIFLRYLASGSYIHISGELCGISYTSSWRAVHRIMNLILNKRHQIIKFPSNLERIATQFKAKKNIPDVIGCIDGTHIEILVPKSTISETFRNRKGWMSINAQMICGPDNLIYDIDASWPGSSHDSNVWASSGISRRFESGEFGDYRLLGDSGYPLSQYIITPFRNDEGIYRS